MAKMSRDERRARLKQRHLADIKNGGGSGSTFKPILDTKEFDSVDFFKIKKGKNTIDIIPFLVSMPEKMPVDAKNTKYVTDDEVYVLNIYRHTNVGPNDDQILCLNKTYGKACPICEARKEMMDNGVAYDSKEEQAVRPKWRSFYNVIDLEDEDKGVQIYDGSGFQFQRELCAKAEYLNEGFETFSDLEDGATVTFRGSPETFNKKEWFKPMDFGFESRDPYEESIFDDAFPLDKMLSIPTYGEVQNLFLGLDVDEDEPEQEDDGAKEKPKTSRTRKKKEEPKEEVKEEKTSRRSRRSKKEEEPEPSGKCPYEFIFGIDWDGQEACQECEDDCYNSCEIEYNLIREAEPKEEPEPEPEKEEPKTKRRARKRR